MFNLSPNHGNEFAAGAGKSGLTYQFEVRESDSGVGLCIDFRGKEKDKEGHKEARKEADKEANRHYYTALLKSKGEIERRFGDGLVWESMEKGNGYRIHVLFPEGYEPEIRWAEVQDTMIDAMIRLVAAMKDAIKSLKGI